MRLEISVFGLLIIAFYSAVVLVVVALPLRKLLAEYRWKWAVIVPPVIALLALPWAEEIWIAWHFNQLCKDAGVHVVRQVEVEGFADDTSRSSRVGLKPGLLYSDPKSLAEFDKAGYRFKEYMLEDGGVWHVERHSDGVYGSILEHPMARYHYKHAYQPKAYMQAESMGWKTNKEETRVLDSETGEVLGRDTRYIRYSNAVEWLWVRFFGHGTSGCSGPLDQPEKGKRVGQIYQYVLIPKKVRI